MGGWASAALRHSRSRKTEAGRTSAFAQQAGRKAYGDSISSRRIDADGRRFSGTRAQLVWNQAKECHDGGWHHAGDGPRLRRPGIADHRACGVVSFSNDCRWRCQRGGSVVVCHQPAADGARAAWSQWTDRSRGNRSQGERADRRWASRRGELGRSTRLSGNHRVDLVPPGLVRGPSGAFALMAIVERQRCVRAEIRAHAADFRHAQGHGLFHAFRRATSHSGGNLHQRISQAEDPRDHQTDHRGDGQLAQRGFRVSRRFGDCAGDRVDRAGGPGNVRDDSVYRSACRSPLAIATSKSACSARPLAFPRDAYGGAGWDSCWGVARSVCSSDGFSMAT